MDTTLKLDQSLVERKLDKVWMDLVRYDPAFRAKAVS